MKRVFALVGAVAMIAAAVAIRAALDDQGGGGGGDTPAAVPAVLACDPALAAVCQALTDEVDDLEVVVEDAAATAARLDEAASRPDEVGIDAWLTLAPQPDLVAEERDRAGLRPVLGEVTGPLARSPLALVAWQDRAEALVGTCGTLDWRCLGDHAGQAWDDAGGSGAWGRVEPGLSDPVTDAVGLTVAGQAAVSYFERPDFASNDFDGTFRSWWSGLLDAVPSFPASRGTVLAQMLAAGPASYDAVGTTEAEAVPSVAASRDADRLVVSYPDPVVTADVVLAPVLGSDAADDLADLAGSDTLARALVAAGWRVDGQDLPTGADPDLTLPADDQLPRAGVLEALRSL